MQTIYQGVIDIKKISLRLSMYIFFLTVQGICLSVLIISLNIYSDIFRRILHFAAFLISLRIIFRENNPAFKIIWSFILLTFPALGLLLYAAAVSQKSSVRNYKNFSVKNIRKSNGKCAEKLKNQSKTAYFIYRYLNNISNSDVYENSDTELFSCGELFFMDYLKKLSEAEKFIFIEYFIIANGEMWNRILDILIEKAKKGVEIRIIYDGLGTLNCFSDGYFRKLNQYGIKSASFNKFSPFIAALFRCRDHRKITVIDNKTAYTGGINLSDEYINLTHPHGYWKDYAVKISGDAVSGFTELFINSWNFCTNSHDLAEKFFIEYSEKCSSKGFSIPFGDIPYSKNPAGKLVYMDIIRSAEKYVYIVTPYLILDDEMISLLKFKAFCGIDLKIVTPHIPDKKYVHAVTRSDYKELIESGVRIYEYSKGFVHAKAIVSDDDYAVTGTVNFDFRSFHLLFENSIFMFRTDAVYQLKSDYLKMLEESIEITDQFFTKRSFIKKFTDALLKFFAPLM